MSVPVLFLLQVLLYFASGVYCDVCSNRTEFRCFCKQLTDEKSHRPVSVASCQFRGFETFPYQIEDDLNVLDFGFNNIQSLDKPLIAVNLKMLVLSHNKISKINSDFFSNLPELVELDLSYNQLSSIDDWVIFKNIPNLSRLDLSYNNLESLPGGIFQPLNQLRYLDISYNYLTDVLTSKSALIEFLNLTPDLTHLKMNGLNLTTFNSGYFNNFNKMTSLSLADNNLEIIPTVPSSLKKLDLSGNALTEISARYLNYPSLEELKLNRMDTLTKINHYAFYNLYSLQKLVITDCPNLEEFNEIAFDVASKNYKLHPKELILARNGLKSLNESYKYFFRHMQKVDLRHNPWDCDCDILWLRDYDHVLYKPEDIKCNTPQSLRHRSLLDLQKTDLPECYPEIYGKKSHRILIVVLTMSIILLCGVIFYLVRYPSSWLASSRTMGPTSPYSLASTSEIK